MSNIKNIEGLSGDDLRAMVSQGGKFVYYPYAISIVIMSFRNNSDIHFVRPGESSTTPGIKYMALSALLGWWGIPWGPIYTIGSIYHIAKGGKDVTAEVMSEINQNDPTYGHGGYGEGLSSNNGTDDNNSGYNLPGNNGGQTYNIQ